MSAWGGARARRRWGPSYKPRSDKVRDTAAGVCWAAVRDRGCSEGIGAAAACLPRISILGMRQIASSHPRLRPGDRVRASRGGFRSTAIATLSHHRVALGKCLDAATPRGTSRTTIVRLRQGLSCPVANATESAGRVTLSFPRRRSMCWAGQTRTGRMRQDTK